jgi:hypothetical protein
MDIDLVKLLGRVNTEGSVPVKIVQGVHKNDFVGKKGRFVEYKTDMSSKFGVVVDNELIWFMEDEIEVIE